RFFGSPAINVLEPIRPLVPRTSAAVDMQLGIRPEHVTVGTGAAPPDAVAGRVYLVEPLGADTWVTVKAEGLRLTGRAAGDFAAPPGVAAWARIHPAELLRFDARTGVRLE